MNTMLRAVALIVLVAACTPGPKSVTTKAAEDPAAREAFHAYGEAINSNSLDQLLAVLTEDVVYQGPHEPEVVGKAAVKTWLESYLGAYKVHWDKTSNEFVQAGDWAFERYSYKENDEPKAGGAPLTDTGKGLLIYHKDADGKWRVARDAWSSDLPIAK